MDGRDPKVDVEDDAPPGPAMILSTSTAPLGYGADEDLAAAVTARG
jgi:hypothetical protein